MAVKSIPDGYQSVIPYLVVEGVDRVLDFMEKTFDAKIVHRSQRPDGKVGHCEARIADSVVMLGEPMGEQYPSRPSCLYVYVANVDETYKKAIAAGAKSQTEPKDQPYGDRSCGVFDPGGNAWWIATRIENLSPEEIDRRMAAARK